MLPGKKFTPEDIVRILRRRIWLLIVPFAVVSAATVLVVRQLPDQYRSDTLIRIVPPAVSESLIRSTINVDTETRLMAIQQRILSRTRLERLILDLNLYPGQRAGGIMQDVVERMVDDIRVQPAQGDTFRVSYVGSDPATVMRVTQQLGTLFKDESLLDRSYLAEQTSQFLDSELETARQQLSEREKQLADYRRRHAGELPSQMESNLQAIQNAQMQMQAALQNINQYEDRRLVVERQIANLESMAPTAGTASTVGPDGALAPTTAQRLAAARKALADMQSRLTPQHPDIAIVKKNVADLEKQLEEESLNVPVSAPVALPPTELTRLARLGDLRLELDQITRHIEEQEEIANKLRGVASEYQRRADVAPTRESELIELTRDYGELDAWYSSLLSKRQASQTQVNLETRQIGETFRIIDPARVPARPFSPNRTRLNQLGMLAGLALGLAIIGLLEYVDNSVKSEDELKMIVGGLPVLAVVPLMRSPQEQRRRTIRHGLVHATLGLGVLGCLAVVGYAFLR